MKRPVGTLCLFVAALFWLANVNAAPQPSASPAAAPEPKPSDPKPAEPKAKDRATLEKEFAALLTNATLVGYYSASDSDKPSKEDRYDIVKAVKADGDNWVITAKMSYKGMSVPLDFTVPVVWAGDTPVITLTKQSVMGMGPFTVRILFYDNQYGGMWSSPRHGGQMWGRVERTGKVDPNWGKPATKPAEAAPKTTAAPEAGGAK